MLIRAHSFLQSTAGQFDACNDFVTGLHWQILFANVGDLVNPQAKIIGAKYTFTKQTLRFQVSSFAFCYLVFVLVSSLSNAGVFYSVLECIVSLVTATSLSQSRSRPRSSLSMRQSRPSARKPCVCNSTRASLKTSSTPSRSD